jgi:hypothetical protein
MNPTPPGETGKGTGRLEPPQSPGRSRGRPWEHDAEAPYPPSPVSKSVGGPVRGNVATDHDRPGAPRNADHPIAGQRA